MPTPSSLSAIYIIKVGAKDEDNAVTFGETAESLLLRNNLIVLPIQCQLLEENRYCKLN